MFGKDGIMDIDNAKWNLNITVFAEETVFMTAKKDQQNCIINADKSKVIVF